MKSILQMLFLIVIMNMIVSCASPPPPKPPIRWETSEQKTGESKYTLSDFKFNVINLQQVEILGKISNCAIQFEKFRYREGEYYGYRKRIGFRWETCKPREIIIRTPYQKTTAQVSSGGSFSSIISTPQYEKEFFQRPTELNNYKIKFELKPIEIEPLSISGVEFEPKKLSDIQVWYYEYSPTSSSPKTQKGFNVSSALEKFKKKHIAKIVLNFQDKQSHLPIAPDIKITEIQRISTNELIEKCISLGYSKKESRKIIDLLNKALPQGQTINRHGQLIIFDGIIGSKYFIEASHGKYYAFSGTITINKSQDHKRTILMVEKGIKIRSVEEGTGGIIVN